MPIHQMSNLNGVFRAVVNVSKFHMVIIQPYRMSVSMTAKKMLRLFTIQRKRTVKMTVNSSEITDIFLIIQLFLLREFRARSLLFSTFQQRQHFDFIVCSVFLLQWFSAIKQMLVAKLFLAICVYQKTIKVFPAKNYLPCILLTCLLITLQHYFLEKLLAIFVSCQTYLRHKLVKKIVWLQCISAI